MEGALPKTEENETIEIAPPGAAIVPFNAMVLAEIETFDTAEIETLGVIEKRLPAANERVGAVMLILSSVSAPVDDKNRPTLFERTPPLREKSPAQLSAKGDPELEDEVWMPEQNVVGALPPVAAKPADDTNAKPSSINNGLSIRLLRVMGRKL